MQLQNCNASLLGEVFLWVNLTPEDETPQPFHQEKGGNGSYWTCQSCYIYGQCGWGRSEQQHVGDSSVQGRAVSMVIFLPYLLWCCGRDLFYVCSAAPLLLPCLKTPFVPICCCKGGAGVAGWEGEPMTAASAVDALQAEPPKVFCWNFLNC